MKFVRFIESSCWSSFARPFLALTMAAALLLPLAGHSTTPATKIFAQKTRGTQEVSAEKRIIADVPESPCKLVKINNSHRRIARTGNFASGFASCGAVIPIFLPQLNKSLVFNSIPVLFESISQRANTGFGPGWHISGNSILVEFRESSEIVSVGHDGTVTIFEEFTEGSWRQRGYPHLGTAQAKKIKEGFEILYSNGERLVFGLSKHESSDARLGSEGRIATVHYLTEARVRGGFLTQRIERNELHPELITSLIDRYGRSIRIDYNSDNLADRAVIVDPVVGTIEFGFEYFNGQLYRVIPPETERYTEITYDWVVESQVVTIVDGDDIAKDFYYYADGTLLRIVEDPLGTTRYSQFNYHNNKIEIESTLSTVSFQFNSNGALIGSTAKGRTTRFVRDELDRITYVIDPFDRTEIYKYHSKGSDHGFPSRIGDASGSTVEMSNYAGPGAPRDIRYSSGLTLQVEYDKHLLPLSKVYSNGTTFHWVRNDKGQTKQVLRDGVVLESFKYTSNGLLSQVTDGATGLSVDYAYDQFGNLSEIDSPQGTQQFEYSPYGFQLTHTDETGIVSEVTARNPETLVATAISRSRPGIETNGPRGGPLFVTTGNESHSEQVSVNRSTNGRGQGSTVTVNESVNGESQSSSSVNCPAPGGAGCGSCPSSSSSGNGNSLNQCQPANVPADTGETSSNVAQD